MSRAFGGEYHLVEANPDLAGILQRSGAFHIVNCAITNRPGTVNFHIAINDEGSSVLNLPESNVWGCILERSVEIKARTLASLLADVGDRPIDLIKMDIEGAETEVLETIPEEVLGRIGQLTVEFHSDPKFGFVSQGDARRVNKVIARLRRNHFACLDFSAGRRYDVLFINREIHRISRWLMARWRWWDAAPRWIHSLRRGMARPFRNGLHFNRTR